MATQPRSFSIKTFPLLHICFPGVLVLVQGERSMGHRQHVEGPVHVLFIFIFLLT